MIADPESVAVELRRLSGVKDVEIVQFPSGKELWVILKNPVDIGRLQKASASLGYVAVRSGWLPSKLPRSLAEMIWDGVTCVVSKHTHVPGEQRYAARLMMDLATGEMIYHSMESDGLKILQEYLTSVSGSAQPWSDVRVARKCIQENERIGECEVGGGNAFHTHKRGRGPLYGTGSLA